MWEVEINNILHKGSSIREEVQRQKILLSLNIETVAGV